MIKKLILIICFCLIASTVWADKYYVYIENKGYVAEGEEAGHNQRGDVITVAPFTPQYKPTRAEKSFCKIIVVDLTQEEVMQLLEPKCEGGSCDVNEPIVLRARKRKVDMDALNIDKQEKEIAKNVLFEKIAIKPSIKSISH